MRKISDVYMNNRIGFVIWLIYSTVIVLEFINASLIMAIIKETYIFESIADAIFISIIAGGFPFAWSLLTYHTWFKK